MVVSKVGRGLDVRDQSDLVLADSSAEFDLNIFSFDVPSFLIKVTLLFGEVGEILFFGFDLILENLDKVGGFSDVAREGVGGNSHETVKLGCSSKSLGDCSGKDSGDHLN